MLKNRDEQIDGLKYFLICLVVLMHCSQGGRYSGTLSTAIYSVIYGFHMPLFVLLSGYFFHCDTLSKVHKANLKIIEPLLLFHLFSIRTINPFQWVSFEPCPLWYLLSLMCWRYMAYYLNKVTDKIVLWFGFSTPVYENILMIISSIILYIASFIFINKYGTLFSVMRTMQFFPYFIIGTCLSPTLIDSIRKKVTIRYTLAILGCLCIILLAYYSGPSLNAVNFGKYGIADLSNILKFPLNKVLFVKITVNLMSLVICFMLLSWFKAPKYICQYGRTTLFILVTHIPFYYLLIRVCHNFYYGLFLGLATLVLLTSLAKSKYTTYIIYPVSSLYKKYYAKK